MSLFFKKQCDLHASRAVTVASGGYAARRTRGRKAWIRTRKAAGTRSARTVRQGAGDGRTVCQRVPASVLHCSACVRAGGHGHRSRFLCYRRLTVAPRRSETGATRHWLPCGGVERGQVPSGQDGRGRNDARAGGSRGPRQSRRRTVTTQPITTR